MRKKRGMNLAQASVEYLMVVGIAFVIIVPMVYIFFNYSTEMSQEVTQAKVGRIAGNLVDAAEEVFYLGEPSKSTVNFDMPGGVFDAFIPPNSREVMFYLGDDLKSTEIVAFSNVNLLGYLTPEDLSPGKHSYRVEAKSKYSLIYTGDPETARQRWCAYFIARQIERNARTVFNDKIDRSVKLFMPVECELVDVCLSPELKKVTTIIKDANGEDYTSDRTISVSVQEENAVSCNPLGGGTIDAGLAEAFYDFLYTASTPTIPTTSVTITAPACYDIDGDGYGTVMYSTECTHTEYDCNDDDDNTYPGALEICDGNDNDCDGIEDSIAGECVAQEICNGIDDDGDILIDEDFDLQTDQSNCGTCGNACSVGQTCTAGACNP